MVKIRIDPEYMTMFEEEKKFLSNKGIRYTFVKYDNEGKSIWKYKKTPRLFSELSKFYENVYSK